MLVRVVEQYHGVVVGYYRFLILYAVGVHELEWRFLSWKTRRRLLASKAVVSRSLPFVHYDRRGVPPLGGGYCYFFFFLLPISHLIIIFLNELF